MQKLNIKRQRTTAYHPASNGAIERFHRTLKNSLRAHTQQPNWIAALPLVLLGIRATINKQGYSPAQLTYGSNIDLPTHFFTPNKPDLTSPTSDFLEKFFKEIQNFPIPKRQHHAAHFIPKDLKDATHVWIRDPSPKSSLSPRYTGPYPVVSQDGKVVIIKNKGQDQTISIDRVKPAFLDAELVEHKPLENKQETISNEKPENPNKTKFQPQQTQQKGQPETPKTQTLDIDTVVNYQSNNMKWPAVIINITETPLNSQRKLRNNVALRLFGNLNNHFVLAKQTDISAFKYYTIDNKALQDAIEQAQDFSKGLSFPPRKSSSLKKVNFQKILPKFNCIFYRYHDQYKMPMCRGLPCLRFKRCGWDPKYE